MIRILAIPGSLRSNASSNAILRAISTMVPEDVALTVYNGVGTLPHFNDSNETPESVVSFREQLQATDGILICQPEYAFGVAGSLKNALDWTVSSGDFVNKPVALITAATSGEKAHAAMLLTLTAMSSRIIEDASLLISFVKARLDPQGGIKDPETKHRLENAVDAFVQEVRASSGATAS